MSDPRQGITGREMCEYIAVWMQETTGQVVTPEEIWNMSPTGEIWPIRELYEQALSEREPEGYQAMTAKRTQEEG